MSGGKLSRNEQETHFSQSAVDRMDNTVYVYSDDPVWIRKLEKMGFEGKQVDGFGGYEFVCENCLMSIRRKRTVELTEERREELAERMRNVRDE